VIALPPSLGAENETVICESPGATDGCAGAVGTVLGITTADAGEGGPAPFAFVAVTVHEYNFPFVNLLTTIGEFAPEADPAAPPLEDVQFALYPVIALPPSAGAANDTLACALPDAATGCAGAPGTVLGVTATDAADAGPSPFRFVAATVHVYDLPFVRVVTRSGEPLPDAEPDAPPFDDEQSALYDVIGLPPSSGAPNETEICAFAGATAGWSGAAGTVLGTTAGESGDGEPVPSPFVAVTEHVYVLPLLSALTTSGESVPDAAPATPPSDDTHDASKPVMMLPPSSGATKDTVICESPPWTAGCAGALGGSAHAVGTTTAPTATTVAMQMTTRVSRVAIADCIRPPFEPPDRR